MQQPEWKLAVVQACRHQRWQEAYAKAAVPCLRPDDWKKVAEYIEGEKAKALEALCREWRERRGH